MKTQSEDFVIDDRPIKYDPKTFETVYPADPRYDSLPNFNRNTLKFEYAEKD